MRKGDKEYLEKLLEMAATMTMAELKIALDLGERETIEVTKEVINNVSFYSMKVNEHQLHRLRKAMQMTFQFVEI